VGEDGEVTRSAQLGGERDREASAAQDAAGRSEAAHAAVRREFPRHGRLGEDDHLVDAPRKCADLRNGRGKEGVLRIHLLRDEDDPLHGAAASRTARTRLAYSSGVWSHGSTSA
jgi:hypothetical protein